jgi:diguanylate cyclase (GGDEF)-like protein
MIDAAETAPLPRRKRDLLLPFSPPPAPPSSLRILIAEDDPISSRIMNKTVQGWGFGTVPAGNGSEAWKGLQDPKIRLAILDWEMPEANGPDLCRRLRSKTNENYTYIILLTSRDDPQDIIAGLEAGADDYMTKPVKFQELKARLQTGRRIVELEDKLLNSQKRLFELATKDGLTGLWNRRTILQFLSDALSQGVRQKTPTGVIMMDVDYFKAINDTCGHQAGDKVLTTLAARLQEHIRPYDRIGRYGGDEFIIVLPDCGIKAAANIAERLRDGCIRKPARFKGQPLGFTLSIGCAATENMTRPTAERLIRAGDQALYEAKRSGRDRVIIAPPARKRTTGKGPAHASPKK